ncbi:hypothetical protein [Flavobacterium sp. TSSA_36]|uniref:hypothetical protein n=1 Tax=Flavobacterium sp. TSSA_36 TaxID=3447669 RepID=UPI003F3A112C
MKTKLLVVALLSIAYSEFASAQNRTTISIPNDEISDNLDLKAVASVFGESTTIQDFERRLNDPRRQISNLDLNYDNQVDYLRVVESVEGATHVVVIQAVLGRHRFQDVATLDIERKRNNTLSIQIVGDVFMYGPNFIYEPVYYSTPAIYASFYSNRYRPYCSSWNWNYYPSYYVSWRPTPIYHYRSNVANCIDVHNYYHYVSYRKSYYAPTICAANRQNDYEKRYPDHSFSKRNSSVANRYDLEGKKANRRVDDNEYQKNSGAKYTENRSSNRVKNKYQPDYNMQGDGASTDYDYSNGYSNTKNTNKQADLANDVSSQRIYQEAATRRSVPAPESIAPRVRYEVTSERRSRGEGSNAAENRGYLKSERSSNENRHSSVGNRRI